MPAQEGCDVMVAIGGVPAGGAAAPPPATARPPHLRAVVAIEGSTDPYEYEVMRSGSTGLAMILASWSAGTMLCLNSVPPIAGTPRDNGDEVWAEHLDGLTPWHFAWRDHPARDEYWQAREVDPSTVEVPTMVVSGWRDTNVMGALRDFSRLGCPKRLIVGPWQHGLPDRDGNRPIHTVKEMTAWFDLWMREEEPAESRARPETDLFVLGADQWESYDEWPATDLRTFYLDGAKGLVSSPPSEGRAIPVVFDASVGVRGGFATSHAPQEQSEDDARSALFDSEPLAEPLELLGELGVDLNLAGITPDVDVAVRVLDVDPAGGSSLVSKGFLRLSNLAPDYVGKSVEPPGATVRIMCNPVRYHLRAGHRLRLAVAGADFPEMWPAPRPVDYGVIAGGQDSHSSRLTIPVVTANPGATPRFEPPDKSLIRPPAGPGHSTLTVSRSDSGRVTVEASSGTSLETFDKELVEFSHSSSASTTPYSPEQTQVTTEGTLVIHQHHRTVAIAATSYTSTDIASATVDISIDGESVFHKRFRHPPGE
ncbi:CocE/NonD family hydrolase [Kribbella sp. NPDC050124]|uniref:CocE/NonD family hydrolase n=1 Tax=Kribbella sp. NPDC050124 TaxID=3364114 RepID=UPI0037B3D4E9